MWSASYHLTEETSRFILSTGGFAYDSGEGLKWPTDSCGTSTEPEAIVARPAGLVGGSASAARREVMQSNDGRFFSVAATTFELVRFVGEQHIEASQ
jgi:hypothetical protein